MEIEEYSNYKHFYSNKIPILFRKHINTYHWKTFLDVGCGDGGLLFSMNKEGYFKGKKVYAIDLSKERVKRSKSINPEFECFVASAIDMKPIKDNSIDLLVSTQVIEHVPDDNLIIEEIGRVLNKNNNLVYLSTVFKKWYGWYFYRCNNRWRLDPTHVREYTHNDQLLDILREHNFNILEIKKTLFWFSATTPILRLLNSDNKIITNNKIIKLISKIKIPIIGYYNWEIICRLAN